MNRSIGRKRTIASLILFAFIAGGLVAPMIHARAHAGTSACEDHAGLDHCDHSLHGIAFEAHHSQRIVVMNAGIAQEGQQWGGEHAPEIDPFSMGSVELIRGAAGVEYGVGAIGGVIRIEPEQMPWGEPFGGRLSLNGFSNNRQGAGSLMLHGSPRSTPEFGWRVQGSIRHAGDSHTPDYTIGNSAFREKDGAAMVEWHDDRVGLRIHGSHFGTTLGLYSGAHIGNYDDLIRAIERGEPAVDFDFTYDIDPPKQEIRHDALSVNGHVITGSGDWIDVQPDFRVTAEGSSTHTDVSETRVGILLFRWL